MTAYIAAPLLLVGASLGLIAGIGLHRLPDLFSRMHAATKPATLGLVLTLLGVAFVLGDASATAKLGAVIILQFVTAPISAHLIGRSAYVAGTELSPDTRVEESVDATLRGTSAANGTDPGEQTDM